MDRKELIWGFVCQIRSEKAKHSLIIIVSVSSWRTSYSDSWDTTPWVFIFFRGQAEISKFLWLYFIFKYHSLS